MLCSYLTAVSTYCPEQFALRTMCAMLIVVCFGYSTYLSALTRNDSYVQVSKTYGKPGSILRSCWSPSCQVS